jgi:hypothetical protein
MQLESSEIASFSKPVEPIVRAEINRGDCVRYYVGHKRCWVTGVVQNKGVVKHIRFNDGSNDLVHNIDDGKTVYKVAVDYAYVKKPPLLQYRL